MGEGFGIGHAPLGSWYPSDLSSRPLYLAHRLLCSYLSGSGGGISLGTPPGFPTRPLELTGTATQLDQIHDPVHGRSLWRRIDHGLLRGSIHMAHPV